MPNKLTEYLERFKEQKILVLGDLILDEYIFGDVNRISPEAPVPIVDVKEKTYAPGGAANVAMNIASLEGKVFLSGVTGSDEQGLRLKDIVEKAGINTEAIVEDDSRPTTLKTRIIAHEQQVVRVDWENRIPISDSTKYKLLAGVKASLKSIGLIVISDYNKGVNRRDFLQDIISLAHTNDIHVLVDPKGKDFSKYQNATILTPNKKEASIASEYEIKDDESLKEVAEILIRENNLESIVITLGDEGIFVQDTKGNSSKYPSHTQEVYDVTGAGDTVIAVLALSMVAGAHVTDAAQIANIAAGISVSKLGAAAVTQAELRRELELI